MSIDDFLQLDTEAVEQRRIALKAVDPFGGAFADDHGDVLAKRPHQDFREGHRVVVDSPDHHTHGAHGTITRDGNDSALEVKLDSGHVIRVPEWELVPEDYPTTRSTKADRSTFVEDTLAKYARGEF